MSDTHCVVCGRRIVSSMDRTQWWHWPNFVKGGDNGLETHAKEPYLHRAEPPAEAEADSGS